MALPRNLIEPDWFRTVGTWNPVSYLVEGIRSLVIRAGTARRSPSGSRAPGGIALVSLMAAASALRTQMVRT